MTAAPFRHSGVGRYSRALVDRFDKYFRDSANPRPEDERALVVGIYGPWGCGKTTWLQALEEEARRRLGKPAKHAGLTSMTVAVMFNAWQYEKEAHLIVPLLKTAEVAVRQAMTGASNEDGDGAYWAWARERAVMLWDVTVALVAGLKGELGGELGGLSTKMGLDGGKIVETWTKRQAERAAKGHPLPSPMDAYESLYFDLHRYMQALTGRGERPEALDWLTQGERALAGSLSSDESIDEQDLRALSLWQRRKARKLLAQQAEVPANAVVADESPFRLNLLFLIDDLDRCLPEKAVEMLESIKLFLEVPGCAFVVAVDDEIVGRGIQHRYRDYLPKVQQSERSTAERGPITGAEYLEKIIHLPVRVPVLESAETREFLQRRWPELFRARGEAMGGELGERPSEEPPWDDALLDLFVHAVPPVPRKIVRAVELFGMLHEMAERLVAEQRFGATRYEPLMLARLVILQLHAPEVHREGSRRRGVGFLDDLVGIKRAELAGKTLTDLVRECEATRDDANVPTPDSRNARDAAARRATLAWRVLECRESRAGFDPLSVVDVRESYEWPTRVACHYRLVASETVVDAAIRGRERGRPAAPKDLNRFLDLVLSADSSDWRRGLAEESELDGFVLDERSLDVLFARIEERRDMRSRITLDWVEQLGALLPLPALARLYRTTGLLERPTMRPREVVHALGILCRIANPAHVPLEPKKEVVVRELVDVTKIAQRLAGADFCGGYFVGLDVRGVALEEDPQRWAGADLRAAQGLEFATASCALGNPTHPPLRPWLGVGRGAMRGVCRIDEQRLASGGSEGNVRVWSLASPDAEPIVLRGHSGEVLSVCGLDDQHVASGGEDGTVRVWGLASPNAEPIVLRGHSGEVLSVCRLDGQRLASASADGTVRVWSSVSSDAAPIVFRGHSGIVWSVCPLDQHHLASSGDDGTIRVWSLVSPAAAPIVLSGHSGAVLSVCRFDNQHLISANEDGTLRAWSLGRDGGEPLVPRGAGGAAWSVCRLDEQRLASAHDEGTVRVWRLASPDLEPIVLRGHSGAVLSVCGLDDQHYASAGADGSVRVWRGEQPVAVALTLEGNTLVRFDARPDAPWPIRITHPTRAWRTQRVSGIDLPADSELYQLAGFEARDLSHANDVHAPIFRIGIHEYPEAHGKLWAFADERRTLQLAWPSDSVEREKMRRWIFGPNLQ